MIDSVSATQAKQETAPAALGLPATQTVSQQEFLTLFIEQLKNQDPLSPLEPSELTAQLAQFSSLEQLTGINTRLDALTDATARSTSSALLSLLGRRVAVDGGRLGLEDGKAPEVQYTLDQAATEATATVSDPDGSVVRVIELGAQAAGAHTFTFDGKSKFGLPLADGDYQIALSATVAGEDTPLAVPTRTLATVDGVDLGANPPVLIVGGTRVGLEAVREVHAASPDA